MAEVFAVVAVDVHVDELDRPVVQWADFTHDAGDWSIALSPSANTERRVRIRFRSAEQLRDWAHALLSDAVKMAPAGASIVREPEPVPPRRAEFRPS